MVRLPLEIRRVVQLISTRRKPAFTLPRIHNRLDLTAIELRVWLGCDGLIWSIPITVRVTVLAEEKPNPGPKIVRTFVSPNLRATWPRACSFHHPDPPITCPLAQLTLQVLSDTVPHLSERMRPPSISPDALLRRSYARNIHAVIVPTTFCAASTRGRRTPPRLGLDCGSS